MSMSLVSLFHHDQRARVCTTYAHAAYVQKNGKEAPAWRRNSDSAAIYFNVLWQRGGAAAYRKAKRRRIAAGQARERARTGLDPAYLMQTEGGFAGNASVLRQTFRCGDKPIDGARI